MLERDSFRNLDNWTMDTHIKQESLNYEENNFGGRTVFPVWQMLHDEEEEDDGEDEVSEHYDSESVTRLTGNVRACYLNHLEKIVIKNYETCSDRDRTEWPFSRADLLKCAAWLEYKALRSCMVVILYQRAMTRLVTDIKKHTEQLKIYTKLKHFMSFDTGWSTKTTQTCEEVNYIDQETQTDLDIEMYLQGEPAFETHDLLTTLETDDVNYQYLESLNCITANPDTECANAETLQGVPIPVYVSGMSSSGFKSRNTHNIRVVKNIETVSLSELNTVQNIPLPNGIEPVSDQNVDVPNKETGVIVTKPYEWSVIEEKNERKRTRPRVRVKRLSSIQENKPLSNGMFNSSTESESHKMTLDQRIAAVLGIENPEFSDDDDAGGAGGGDVGVGSGGDDEIHSEKTAMEVDKEPSMWTIQKCQQQELLRAKILEKCVVSVKKRGQMRLRFLELFGSDSEDCFDIDEEITNYKDKLARWVVVSLMPYYREGRIISRPVFKCLARHIADKLLKRNRWPNESDVMQSVVEFFSCHSKIERQEDI